MTTTTNDTQDKIPTTSRISSEKRRKLYTHEQFDQIKQDADLEAYEDLSDEQQEIIDQADEEISGWSPSNSYFELNKHRVCRHKLVYLRMDIYGLPVNAEQNTDMDIEKLKEAIKIWNSKKLTLEFAEKR